jgi:plastocyanin
MLYKCGNSSSTARQFAVCFLIVSALCFVVLVPTNALADNIITILPGASERTSTSYFDSNYYLTKPGKTVKWYNTDDISHKIILSSISDNRSSAATRQIAESGLIPHNGNFSYRFDNDGIYEYSSPNYPWMKGAISVSDDTNSTIVSQNMKNNINIELIQQPTKAKVDKETHFLINFINQKTNRNQKHIDYEFTLSYDNNTISKNNKALFKQGLHSNGGLEQAMYRFPSSDRYEAAVTIYDVLFSPVVPDTARFIINVK